MSTTQVLNQPYVSGTLPEPGSRQALNLYIPSGQGPFPLVVWIHGGGWHSGDRKIAFNEQFTQAGFALASLGYRLTKEGHPFPAQIEDCIAGLSWLMSNAHAHRLDPQRVGLIGHSAGAHLSALLLTCGGSAVFSKVRVSAQAAVLWSPPLDLALNRGRWPESSAFCNPQDPFQTRFFPGGAYDEAFAIQASPTSYADAKLPPLLIVHHERDRMVPIGQAEAFIRIARSAGTDITFRRDTRDLADPHAIPGPELFEEALAFFRQKLGTAAARFN